MGEKNAKEHWSELTALRYSLEDEGQIGRVGGLYITRTLRHAGWITTDLCHPDHGLFEPRPSGRRLCYSNYNPFCVGLRRKSLFSLLVDGYFFYSLIDIQTICNCLTFSWDSTLFCLFLLFIGMLLSLIVYLFVCTTAEWKLGQLQPPVTTELYSEHTNIPTRLLPYVRTLTHFSHVWTGNSFTKNRHGSINKMQHLVKFNLSNKRRSLIVIFQIFKH